MSAKTQNAGAGVDPKVFADDRVSELEAIVAQLRAENAALRDVQPAASEDYAPASQARYGIIVEESNDENEVSVVPVQVNGRAYQITRGAYVEVPREVVSVLTDAVIDKAVPATDSMGNPVGYTLRPARRFPFQSFGKVVDESGNRVKSPMSEHAIRE